MIIKTNKIINMALSKRVFVDALFLVIFSYADQDVSCSHLNVWSSSANTEWNRGWVST